MGHLKRRAEVGEYGRRLHEAWSKATIHEALLDMWMEVNGKDCHPDDMSDGDWDKYQAEVDRRAKLVRTQRGARD